MSQGKFRKLVVVGGGSAGWMAAAAISQALNSGCEIEVVESEVIGVVGVGEATIPPIKTFNRQLGIDEAEFLKYTNGSFKLGIEFVDWTRLNHRYFHPFGSFGSNFDPIAFHHHWIKSRQDGNELPFEDYSMAWHMARAGKFSRPDTNPSRIQSSFDYAYHFDAVLYGKFLRAYCEDRGVIRTEGIVLDAKLNGETGFIESLILDDGREIFGDFFIDCSGFRGLLIEGALKSGYEEWSNWLPCDRAVAVPCELAGEFSPYTRSTAREAGWQWRIPLQHRIGNGYVYSSRYLDDDQAAVDTLMANLDGKPLADPRMLRFTTGRRKKFWNKNCLSLGLSAGFIEPLESTALHLVQAGIASFLPFFPDGNPDPLAEQAYNQRLTREFEAIRDFIILHYHANERNDSDLWRDAAAMEIPDTLAEKLAHFKSHGRVFPESWDLFQSPNWLAVLLGQNVMPQSYHPFVDLRGKSGEASLARQHEAMVQALVNMQPHGKFIDRYCKSDVAD
ncbi:MAG: tryptophan 7-halogenase [Maricaulis sp.]|nr:tryptophan 7-halogenase [Maricaulis sp.]